MKGNTVTKHPDEGRSLSYDVLNLDNTVRPS